MISRKQNPIQLSCWRLLLFTGFCFFNFPFWAFAQMSYDEKASQAIFEYSLRSLKDSADQLSVKNKELASQIEKMEAQIQKYNGDLNSLEGEHTSLSQESIQAHNALKEGLIPSAIMEDKIDDVQGSAHRVGEDEQRLKSRMEARQKQHDELQQSMDNLRDEIAAIQAQIKALKGDADKEDAQEQRPLKHSLTLSQKSLAEGAKKLNQIKSRYAKPLNMLENLKEKESSSRQRFENLQDEMEDIIKEEKNLQSDIDGISRQREDQVNQLNAKIASLTSRQKDLENVLVEANKRISGNDMNPADEEVEISHLKQNFDVLEDESKILKEKMTKLENEYQELQASYTP